MNLTAHDPARSWLPGIVTVPQTVVDASGSEETGADLTVVPPKVASMTQVPPLSETFVTKAEPESIDPEAFQLTPGEKSVARAIAGDEATAVGDGAAEGEAGKPEGPAPGVPGPGEADAEGEADGEADGRAEFVAPETAFACTQLVKATISTRAVTVAPQKLPSVFMRIKAAHPSPSRRPA